MTVSESVERTPVQLLVTCIVDVFYPQVGRAVVDVLEHRGFAVEFPEKQTCCGQPAFNAGHREEARSMAEHTVSVLDATDGPVVVPSGSCASMIIANYRDLLDGDDRLGPAAERVAERVREFTAFVAADAEVERRNPPASGPVTFHPSCHGLRHLGLGGCGEQVLDDLGADRRDLNGAEECCGFGGLFALQMPAVSAAIMDAKLDNVEATGAETLVGYDMSCLMHLGGGLRRRGSAVEVRHIAEMMADEPQS